MKQRMQQYDHQGPTCTRINGMDVKRLDFQINNPRNLTIKCSLYSTCQSHLIQHVLLYLHCNSGCRIQGLAYLKYAIQQHLAYLVFDFAGSGISEGKYVSLGFHQTEDLAVVVTHLRNIINPNLKISLWGRSMGAVTALKYMNQYGKVQTAVFDSPFQSLKSLFLQIGKQKTQLPELLLEVAYKYLKPVIKQKAQFDIDDFDASLRNFTIMAPCIFLASKKDLLIPFSQIDGLFNQYKGPKQMMFLEESHNEPRNTELIQKVFTMLSNNIEKCEQKQRRNQHSYFSFMPHKAHSIRKLELTIKDGSQKTLPKFKEFAIRNNVQQQIQSQKYQSIKLQKKQASDFLPQRKLLNGSNTQSYLNLVNNVHIPAGKPLKPRKFFDDAKQSVKQQEKEKLKEYNENIKGNYKSHQVQNLKANVKKIWEFKKQNPNQNGIKMKFMGEKKSIHGRKEFTDNKLQKDKERKTLQHISNKQQPYVELQQKELRGSLQNKRKAEII